MTCKKNCSEYEIIVDSQNSDPYCKKLEKKINNEHRNNELHKMCREIDSYVSQGHSKKRSFYFVRSKLLGLKR